VHALVVAFFSSWSPFFGFFGFFYTSLLNCSGLLLPGAFKVFTLRLDLLKMSSVKVIMCYSIYRLLVLGFCVTQDTEILWHGMNCYIKFMHILICHWGYVASIKYCGCLTGWWFLDGLQKYRLGKQLHREGGHENTKGGMYHTALFLIKPPPKWFVPLLYVLILSGKSYL